MENLFKSKKARIVLCIVAALLVIGLIGGILAAMGSSYKISSSKTSSTSVISSTSSSSGSSGTGSGSSASSSSPTQYTLTYLPGEYYDGESHCPEPVTVNSGEVVNINFDTHPTRSGYDFVGWATTDGAENPNFEDMAGFRSITMSSNCTLYPVFRIHSEEEVSDDPESVSNVSITIVNSTSDPVVIMDTDEKEELFTVAIGNSLSYTAYTGDGIHIRIASSSSSTLLGTYKGVSYSNESLTSSSYDGYDWIHEPTSGQESFSWYPESNDSFTITVTTK